MKSCKSKIRDLINGSEQKQDIIAIDTFECETGTYRYQDKIITESEKIALEKTCNKLVIFTLAKDKSIIPESEKILNVIVNSPETAETFKKLRNGK